MQVYSRTNTSAKQLAEKLGTPFTTDLQEINKNADLVIISVSDDALEGIVQNIVAGDSLVIHTSGPVGMEILSKRFLNSGVIYPLQTFSKNREADFSEIPLCIEASSPENLSKLRSFAESLSAKVVEIGSDERQFLHLAAVFACNFSNYMYRVADEILRGSNLDFDLLRPLILETAMKVQEMKPAEAQTGPALRRDRKTMGKHIEMLKKYPEWQKIYEIMNKGILEMD